MQHCTKRPDAVAQINGGMGAPQVSGCVEFFQENGRVLVVAKICRLPENETGFCGFHIHQCGTCSGLDFSGTRSHYNPTDQPHPKHAGDLPPLFQCRGNAYLSFCTDRFCVKDIIGRTVVIHSEPDDFRSQPAGNAGRKNACGVIRIVP